MAPFLTRDSVSLEDIESNTGRILANPATIPAQAGQSSTFRFDDRHVLYGKLRPYLNKVALPFFKGRCTTELIPLLPTPDASRLLIALLLRRPQTVGAAMRGVTGARMPRANLYEVLGQEVIVPRTKEGQDALAAKMFARLEAIHRARALCQEQSSLLEVLERKTVEELESAYLNGIERNGVILEH
jgi:type I restriction enzyme, S subunit